MPPLPKKILDDPPSPPNIPYCNFFSPNFPSKCTLSQFLSTSTASLTLHLNPYYFPTPHPLSQYPLVLNFYPLSRVG